jgi:Coenzyme PQQ synthesis protein D (PqqD)
MKRKTTTYLPMKRRQGLVVDELQDEVLVYDLDRHKVHCLNRTAALVWRRCHGKTEPAEIARSMRRELDSTYHENLVWLALRQLAALHLLEPSVFLPPRLERVSRREMIRNLGIAAAVAVPVVTSITAPTAVQALSCRHDNANCTMHTDCCSGLCNGVKCIGG